MDLISAILNRRSVRSFKDMPVPDEVVAEMLEAARLAPSGGNAQNHVFGIVKDIDVKRELARAAGNQMWIMSAPVVVACCARLGSDFSNLPDDDFSLEVNRLRWGADFWDYLIKYGDWRKVAVLLANSAPLIPAEHMFLTAVSHGLSACFIGWLDVDRASGVLGLPDDMKCLFLLPVGYADGQPDPIDRKSIREISFCDTYKTGSGEGL